MNHIYRLKRTGRTQQLQPVPESARNAGKGQARMGKALAQRVAGALASVALSSVCSLGFAQQAPPAPMQLPVAGVVSWGSARIQSSTSTLMTVNQSSPRAVIVSFMAAPVTAPASPVTNEPSAPPGQEDPTQ